MMSRLLQLTDEEEWWLLLLLNDDYVYSSFSCVHYFSLLFITFQKSFFPVGLPVAIIIISKGISYYYVYRVLRHSLLGNDAEEEYEIVLLQYEFVKLDRLVLDRQFLQ